MVAAFVAAAILGNIAEVAAGAWRGLRRVIGGRSRGREVRLTEAQPLCIIGIQQDGSSFFDAHLMPDDTIERIERTQLSQDAAARTAMPAVAADAKEPKPPAR